MSEQSYPAVARAEARGHKLEFDPPFASAALRWTCTVCGRAVIQYGSNIYGSAVESDCAPREE